jgi:hypothetical protein
VTKSFKTDSFERYNSELALIESLTNPKVNNQIIPIWGEEKAESLILELKPLRGIKFYGENMEISKLTKLFHNIRKKQIS